MVNIESHLIAGNGRFQNILQFIMEINHKRKIFRQNSSIRGILYNNSKLFAINLFF